MPNNKPKVYNDGVCYIVEETKAPSSFAAKQNGTNESDYKKIVKLMFEEKTIREQDLEFAEARDRTVNRKIKTMLVESVKAWEKVIIGSMLYDVIYADFDRANKEMYLYLEEVRELVNA